MNKDYILFYDSGIGGLTTLAETLDAVNGQNFIYFADDKNCPYGNKSKKEIYSIVKDNILHLVENYSIKLIVIACNTATACAVENLRKEIDVPIIGIEPAIVPASKQSTNKHILVLATKATLSQGKYITLASSLCCKIESLKMRDLASKIEDHFICKTKTPIEINQEIDEIKQLLKRYPDIDAIVLGCTHYSYLKRYLKIFNIEVFDGNAGVAKRVKSVCGSEKCWGRNTLKIILSSNNHNHLIEYYRLIFSLNSNVKTC